MAITLGRCLDRSIPNGAGFCNPAGEAPSRRWLIAANAGGRAADEQLPVIGSRHILGYAMGTRYGKDLIAQMDALHVPPGALAIWALGQMGFALKGSGDGVIYVDPYLTGKSKEEAEPGEIFYREFPPPVAPDEITNARAVLCSHEHLDHTDAGTIGPIARASPQATFVITGWSHPIADQAGIPAARRITPEVGRPITIGDARVTALPSAHYQVEDDPAKGQRWLGFLIEWNGVTLYHSGDTVIYPGYVEMLKAQPRADVAIVPVNGRDAYRDSLGIVGNLLPLEAAWLARELGWDVLLAGHNDLFIGNCIGAGELPDAIRRFNPRQKMHVLQPGELYLYVK
ncbi:MAG: MBL fold metallo-hydrolase [Anaerolineae bacterium]|nr:MBL fold metallo-hydrolase [Anaerolineae bacterium]